MKLTVLLALLSAVSLAQIDKACFVSPDGIFGNNAGTNFTDLTYLTAPPATPSMRISKVFVCVNSQKNQLHRVQIQLKDLESKIETKLTEFGRIDSTSSCFMFLIDTETDFLRQIRIGYDDQAIKALQFNTYQGRSSSFGLDLSSPGLQRANLGVKVDADGNSAYAIVGFKGTFKTTGDRISSLQGIFMDLDCASANHQTHGLDSGDALLPAKMTNLTEANRTIDSIELRWESLTPLTESGQVFEIISYNLEMRAPGNDTWIELVGQTSVYEKFSLLVDGLIAGAEYAFRVRAKNENGFGPWSDVFFHQTSDVPDQPSAVMTGVQGTNVTISWKAPESHESEITGYELQIQQQDGLFSENTDFCNQLANSCSIKMASLRETPFLLKQGEPVIARVRALNQNGWGPFSQFSTTDVLVAYPPWQMQAPTRGADTNETSIQVNWFALSGNETGGAAITKYNLQTDMGSNGTTWTDIASQLDLTFVLTEGIAPGVTYKFRVRAVNIYGFGPFSDSIAIKTPMRPQAPQAPTISLNHTKVQISWLLPSTESDFPIVAYEISFLTSSLGFTSTELCDGTNEEVVYRLSCSIEMLQIPEFTGLLVDQQIQAKVRARSSIGWSEFSSLNQESEVISTLPQRMEPPTILYAGETSVKFEWQNLNQTEAGGAEAVLADFELEWDQGKGNWTLLHKQNPLLTSYVSQNLQPDSEYAFRVRAVNQFGAAANFSDPIIARTQPVSETKGLPPNSPQAPSIEIVGKDVIISWEAPDDNGAPITFYQVLIKNNLGSFTEVNCEDQQSLSCAIQMSTLWEAPYTLQEMDPIVAIVKANNEHGQSDPSEPSKSIVSVRYPPSPQNAPVRGNLTTPEQIEIVWQAYSDLEDPEIGYYVQVSLGQGFGTATATGLETRYILTDVEPGQTYQFRVATENKWGLSEYSEALEVVAPGYPTKMSPVRQKDVALMDRLMLTWSEPSPITPGGEFPIISYNLEMRNIDEEWVQLTEGFLGLNYTLEGLDGGSQYFFRIRAANQFGFGPFSDEVAFQTTNVPGQPQKLKMEVLENGTVFISWQEAIANGWNISQYQLQIQQQDGLFSENTDFCNQLANSCSIKMASLRETPFLLKQGEPVIARVRALNQNGWGPFSQFSAADVLVAYPPWQMQAPTRGADTNETSIQVNWFALSGNETGVAAITSYNLQTDMGSNGTTWTDIASQLDLTFVLTEGIAPGVTYKFRVRAENIYGFGPFSDSIAIKTPTAPSATSVPLTVIDKEGNIRISWNRPEDGGSPITGFTVQISNAQVQEWHTAPECPETLSLTCSVKMSTLTEEPFNYLFDEVIKVRVITKNSLGSSTSQSNSSGARIRQSPFKMLPPTATFSSNDTSVLFSWPEPTGNLTGNSEIRGYSLYFNGTATAVNSTNFQFEGQEGQKYLVQVAAWNIYGEGPLSDPTEVTIPVMAKENAMMEEDEILQVPDAGSLASVMIEGTNVVVQLNVTNSSLSHEVSVLDASGQWITVPECPNQASEICSIYMETLISLTNLVPGDQITMRTRSANSAGWGPYSEPLTAGFPIQTVPSAPQLSYSIDGSNITVEWDQLTLSESGGSPITGYELFVRNAQDNVMMTLLGGTETLKRFSPFEAGEYAFWLVAINQYGRGPQSEELVVTVWPEQEFVEGEGVKIRLTSEMQNVIVEANNTDPSAEFKLLVKDSNGKYQETPCAPKDELQFVCEINMKQLLDEPLNLSPGDPVEVKVISSDKNGKSKTWLSSLSEMVVKSYPQTAPALSYNNASKDTLTLDWTAIEYGEDGYSPVIAYELQWLVDEQWKDLFTVDISPKRRLQTGVLSYTLQAIQAGEEYTFRIRAANIFGWGEWSEPFTVTAGSTTGPAEEAQPVIDTTDKDSILRPTVVVEQGIDRKKLAIIIVCSMILFILICVVCFAIIAKRRNERQQKISPVMQATDSSKATKQLSLDLQGIELQTQSPYPTTTTRNMMIDTEPIDSCRATSMNFNNATHKGLIFSSQKEDAIFAQKFEALDKNVDLLIQKRLSADQGNQAQNYMVPLKDIINSPSTKHMEAEDLEESKTPKNKEDDLSPKLRE